MLSTDVFAAIVADYADVNGPGDIAVEFKVSPSTVMRWARGTSVPGPAVRQAVVDWIWEQVES